MVSSRSLTLPFLKIWPQQYFPYIIWNSLPDDVRSATSLNSRKLLKTHHYYSLGHGILCDADLDWILISWFTSMLKDSVFMAEIEHYESWIGLDYMNRNIFANLPFPLHPLHFGWLFSSWADTLVWNRVKIIVVRKPTPMFIGNRWIHVLLVILWGKIVAPIVVLKAVKGFSLRKL